MRYYPGIMLSLKMEMDYNLDSTVLLQDNEEYGCFVVRFNKDELGPAIDTFKRAKDILNECRARLAALGFDLDEEYFE